MSTSPTRWSDDGDDVEDAGRDVGLLGDEPAEARGVPRRVGRRLQITVLPVARAWPTLLSVTSNGKFHGMIAPTTPTGSLTTLRRLVAPNAVPTGRSRSHCERVDGLAWASGGASASGASSCGP